MSRRSRLKIAFEQTYRRASHAFKRVTLPEKNEGDLLTSIAAANVARKRRWLPPTPSTKSEFCSDEIYVSSSSTIPNVWHADTTMDLVEIPVEDEDLFSQQSPTVETSDRGENLLEDSHDEEESVGFLETLGKSFKSASISPSSYRMTGMYSVLESEIYQMRCMKPEEPLPGDLTDELEME